MSDTPDQPVVLVHGLGGSADTTFRHNGWMDLIADAGRQAIGIDLLGHGTADKPHDPDAYRELHTYLLAQLPEEPVDAIGFSLGARTLLHAAAVAPERFARLVLTGVGANLVEDRTEQHARITEAIEGTGDTSNPVVRYFADLASDPAADAEALRALIRAPSERLTSQLLSGVTLPVLVLLGDNDFAGPADPLIDLLPDATFIELRNTDHFATPRSMQCLEHALSFVDAAPF